MKSWQILVACAVPCITIVNILEGTALYRQAPSWMLIAALAGLSLTCAGTLRQMYFLRADRRVVIVLGGVFVMTAGSMLLMTESMLGRVVQNLPAGH
jgi:hypothetical protein